MQRFSQREKKPASIIIEIGISDGYGPPDERERELVKRDLRRGYLKTSGVMVL